MNKTITIQTVVNAPIEKVWEYWNKPEHITGWAFASDDWDAPFAENDLRVGGEFKTVGYYALNVAPQAAIAEGGAINLLPDRIANRIRLWWPHFGKKTLF